jgi:hypothetical protein
MHFSTTLTSSTNSSPLKDEDSKEATFKTGSDDMDRGQLNVNAKCFYPKIKPEQTQWQVQNYLNLNYLSREAIHNLQVNGPNFEETILS